MLRILMNLVITALVVLLLANFLPGVEINGFWTSMTVVVVLTLLNLFVKPILQIVTISLTIFTLGLFLFVINAFIVWLCSVLVSGFHIENFWFALLFSLVLSVVQSLIWGYDGKVQKYFTNN